MLGFGWLAVRQAQDAVTSGRLEEAQRLLNQPALQGHKRRGELLRQLARALVERGERRLGQDDPDSSWQDLLLAEQLETGERSSERLRQALTRLGVAQVRALLQAGEPARASHGLGLLHQRQARSPELQVLETATKDWLTAQEQAEQGDFAQALLTVDRLQRLLLAPSAPLERFRQSLEARQRDFAEQLGRLHDAADRASWREVLEMAERILAVAPQHAEARKARTRAWKAIEPVTVAMRPKVEAETTDGKGSANPPQRFCLWVDGVGGYLVCLSNSVTLGQAAPDAAVDVPFVADVSRLHATVTRDGEGGYLLESSRPVRVNGEQTTRSVLKPGDRVTLGTSCQFLFHRPSPVSTTARIEPTSGHRLLFGVDGALLMGDTVVLGPDSQSHVCMPDLKHPVILYRTKDGLGVRHAGKLRVDDCLVQERGVLGPRSHLSGEDFAMAIEPVG